MHRVKAGASLWLRLTVLIALYIFIFVLLGLIFILGMNLKGLTPLGYAVIGFSALLIILSFYAESYQTGPFRRRK